MSTRMVRRNPRRTVRDFPSNNTFYDKFYVNSSDISLTDEESSDTDLDEPILKKYAKITPKKSNETEYQQYVNRVYPIVAKENSHLNFLGVMDIITKEWDNRQLKKIPIEKTKQPTKLEELVSPMPEKSTSVPVPVNNVNKKPSCKFSELKSGDFLSQTSYCKVTRVIGDENQRKVVVENNLGDKWTIGKNIVEREMYSSSQFSRIEKKTMTELANLMSNVKDSVFTVCFTRKLNSDHIETILNENKDLDNKKLSKLLLKGKDRVLVGRMDTGDTVLGRSRVVDLENGGYRLVDHRTIKWIIVKNVKYELK